MKTVISRILSSLLIFMFAGFFGQTAIAQTGVLDPDDPIVVYNPSAPPAIPPANTLAKWVKTNRLGWNTSSFKAYYYNGICFRLRFPNNYVEGDGKKYPLFVFFHGVGERGSIYDNEFSLFHGGQAHMNAVNSGKFDGFLLYPQSSSASGGWSTGQIDVIANLITNYLIPQVQVDPNRVIVNGLSGGGGATWIFLRRHPKLVAADIPMSGAAIQDVNDVAGFVYNPVWIVNGGLDDHPSPYTVNQILNECQNQGSNYKHTFYPNIGHGVWNTFWAEPSYFPYMMAAHKANPWPRYGRTEFCPSDPINVTIGVTAGFDGYEWRKDEVLIPGAGSNTIQATTVGSYSCRIRRGTEWSPWSPIPVVIKLKEATVTPDIQVNGLFSKHLPALDGKTTVDLSVPAGYTSYVWQKLSPTTTLPNSTNVLANAGVGAYQVKVTEQYGCSSSFSNTFNVVNANGPDAPPVAGALGANALSQTQVRLKWTLDPAPAFVETAFEVYQSTATDGPYKLVGFAPARVDSFIATGLSPNVRYYYKVRAVNNTAASAASSVASALTFSDNIAPTPPANLRTGIVGASSVELLWDASEDASGIYKYDIYVNGNVAYTINGDQTQFTVYNLVNAQHATFVVKARDLAGNVSLPSNQVVAAPAFSGLNYKHYTFTGTWNNLPDFNTLTPVATGNEPNVSIANRVQNDNFAYLWEGFIQVPVSGTYYFRTTSDDGSKLYLGPPNGTTSPYSFGATAIVNNDGLHGNVSVNSAAISLTAGVTYPIAITFYEQGGGESMSVAWRTPQTGTNYVSIPNSAFVQTLPPPSGTPAVPSGLTATAVSAKKIQLTWIDNSSNETGFEIYRAGSINGTYSIVATVPANVTSYGDSTCAPATTYYYKIQSINNSGASGLVPVPAYQARWRFNNNYTDASGSGRTLSANSSPTFNSGDKKEGSHSVDLNGSNQDITVNTAAGDYLRGGYNAKTVAFWMRADNTSANRGIFDFGGSDDGLAMRLNSNTIYAGVANNNSRHSISAPYSSTQWNHIALVYNQNSLRLYVNGVQVAANNSLSFSSIGTTTDASMIGDDNGANALNTSFGQFDGRFDDFIVIGSAVTAQEVQDLMNDSYGNVYATTQNLPALPDQPTNLVLTVAGSNQINLAYTGNSPTPVLTEIWRSINNNGSYELIHTKGYNSLPAYNDHTVQPNTTYYYKVRDVNEAGVSPFSAEASATTPANPITVVTFSTVPAQYVVNDSVTTVTLSATSDLGTSITYTSANLPAFATLVNNTITLAPKADDLGVYTVNVTATDNFGGTATTSFAITVAGKNAVTINLNFNQTLPQGAPWNNTNSAPTANLTVNNLKNTNNVTTTVGINLITAFTGTYSNAVTTGNNSGVYPDNVLKTMYFGSNNSPYQFRLTGLTAGKKYSLIIHAGYPWTPQQQATSGSLVGQYTVGAKTVTLDAANNTHNTVRLNGLSPDGSGNIVVTLTKAPGAGFVVINAMQIISYDDSQAAVTFNPPYNVTASGAAADKIRLNWQLPGETRTAVQVWRSTTPNGTYSLRATLGANVTTYTDAGLSIGNTFFYKLRSVNNAVYSDYTSPVGASTITYAINLNLNSQAVLSQGAPWNNFNTLTFDGYTLENMMNTQQQSTGINFHVVKNFTSFHDGVGITTGNNSGAVPDNVMRTLYYVATGDTAHFQLTGLNRTHVYNLEFFAGSTFNYPSVSYWKIGNQIVSINGQNNTTQTVSINGVKPDSTGTISVYFYTPSMYAFLNGLMIYGMPSADNVQDGTGARTMMITGTQDEPAALAIVTADDAATAARQTTQDVAEKATPAGAATLQAYPNPFRDNVTVKFDIQQDVSNFALVVTDIAGKTVFRKEYRSVPKGTWQQSVQFDSKLAPGIYVIQLVGAGGDKPQVVRLLKESK